MVTALKNSVKRAADPYTVKLQAERNARSKAIGEAKRRGEDVGSR